MLGPPREGPETSAIYALNDIDVKAPPFKQCDARRSGGSTGRLASIDCYRWPRIRPSVLCYPILLRGTPRHSHSIVRADDNALVLQRQFFHASKEPYPRSVRKSCSGIQMGISTICDLPGFSDYRYRSVYFFEMRTKMIASRSSKKTVTAGKRLSDTPGDAASPARELPSANAVLL